VDAPEIKVARHLSLLQHLQEMIGPRFNQGQLPKAVEVVIMNGALPPQSVSPAFESDQGFHHLLPGAGDQSGIGSVQVGAGDLEIDGGRWGVAGLVPGIDKPLRFPFVRGAQCSLFAGVVVLPVVIAALAGAKHSIFVFHVVTQGT